MVSHMRKSNLLLIRGAISIGLVFIGARANAASLGIAEVTVNESIGGYHVDHHEDQATASAALSYLLGSGWSEVSLPNGTLKTFAQTSTSDVGPGNEGADVRAAVQLEDYFTLSGLPPGGTDWITGRLHITGTLNTPPGQSANWWSGVQVNFGAPWGRTLYPTEGGEVSIDTVLTNTYFVRDGEAFRVVAGLFSFVHGWNDDDGLSDFSGTAALTFDLPNGTSISSEGGYAPAPPGDYNGDGAVNAADYTVWRDTLGQMGVGLAADGTGDDVSGIPDGDVDQFDYDFWKAHYGETAGSGGGAITVPPAVPEPSSIALVLLALLGLATPKRCAVPNAAATDRTPSADATRALVTPAEDWTL